MTKTALALSFLIVLLSPALAQSATPPTPGAPASDAKPLAFGVVSIKPHDPNHPPYGWRLDPSPIGYVGENISLYKLVQEAYGIFDTKLVTGGPDWVNKDKFDIEAKFETADMPKAKELSYRDRADLLRAVLAERFKLNVHFESKVFPIYNLVIADGGPKFQQTKPEDIRHADTGPVCFVEKQGPDSKGMSMTKRRGCPVKSLAEMLLSSAGRTVIDKTGLTGVYSFELHWAPQNTAADSDAGGGATIFQALQEQLGLKLVPATAPLDVLVIDSAEKPTPN